MKTFVHSVTYSMTDPAKSLYVTKTQTLPIFRGCLDNLLCAALCLKAGATVTI